MILIKFNGVHTSFKKKIVWKQIGTNLVSEYNDMRPQALVSVKLISFDI
jgi:hypothetical protein